MLFSSIQELLTTDVSEVIDKKLIEIKETINLSQFNFGACIDNIDLSNVNRDEIVEETRMMEDIAKLSINLFNDFDYYQQFSFESRYEGTLYSESLASLGCACKDNIWRCMVQPGRSVVHMKVFMYCCYRLICDKLETTDEKVDECDNSVSEVKIENEGSERIEPEDDGDIFHSVINTSEAIVVSEEAGSTVQSSLYNWECPMCDNLNGFVHRVCEVCQEDYLTGSWKCPECNAKNSCVYEECRSCGTAIVREIVAPVAQVVTETPISEVDDELTPEFLASLDATDPPIKGKWECKDCHVYEPYDVANCSKCKYNRNICGRWGCDQCTLFNKCTTVMCEVCNHCNDLLLGKLCKSCSRNRIQVDREHCDSCIRSKGPGLEDAGKWRCLFSHCRSWNRTEDDHCLKCMLWRHGSHIRGDLIKQALEGGGERNVWLCDKCHLTNEADSTVCAKPNCKGTRYKIKYCYGCVKYNDGKSLNCDKCHQRL